MLKQINFNMIRLFKYSSLLTLFIVLNYSCSSNEAEPETPLSNAKAITSFSFVNPAVTGTIDENAHTISIAFPAGTNLNSLAATFATTGAKVTVENVQQISGTTKNDFSKAIIYTVIAEDGSKQDYTITPPSSADILGFTFEDADQEIYWELKGLKEGVNTIYNAPMSVNFDTGFPILPVGAEVTAAGSNEESDYNTTGFTFTVTSADKKTKKSYTIKIPVYNKDTNPYGIYTPEQLLDPTYNLKESFKLMNDITMPPVDGTEYPLGPNYANQGWTPIGDFYSFVGTIDGNGHVIKNLTIKRGSSEDIGFISVLGAKGVIKNLGLVSVNVTGGGNVGALVGNNKGGTISHCYSTGNVKLEDFSVQNHVGGLVGINNDENAKPSKLSNSYSTANVTAGNNSYAGGLVGYNYLCILQNCYATGSLTGTYKNGGALIGKNACEITNCYATGKVVTGGGLVGFNFHWSAAPDCFWDIQTTGQSTSDDGGKAVGKTTAEMQTGTPYNSTWTSANWKFTAGKYPTLVGVGGQ